MEFLVILDLIPDDIKAEILKWLSVVTSFVGSFSILAAATKTKRDDKIMGKIAKIFDLFGGNVANAKNAK